MPIQNANIEFAPPKKGDLDDIDRAFQRLSNVINLINRKLQDPDQPPIKLIADNSSFTQLGPDSFIEYAAGTGTVVLPLANSIIGKRSRILYIMNSGPGTLTVSANRMDTVDSAASITIATGTFKILRSNGENKWMSK